MVSATGLWVGRVIKPTTLVTSNNNIVGVPAGMVPVGDVFDINLDTNQETSLAEDVGKLHENINNLPAQ